MSLTLRFRLTVAALSQVLALTLLVQAAQAAPNRIAAGLVADGPTTPGQSVTIAIHMRPAPGWHGYWLNPGDAGLGMTLDWRLPEGMKAGEPRFPVPRTLLVAGLMNHVYESDYAVLVDMTTPAEARAGTRLPISVRAEWLACTDQICVPERAELRGEVVIAAAAGRADPRFETWRRQLPAPLGAQATFALDSERIRMGIPLPAGVALEEPHFFAARDRVVAYADPQEFRRRGDLLVVELARPAVAAVEPESIAGVLRLNRAGDGLDIAAVPGPVPDGGEPLARTGDGAAGLPLLLLGALLGGFLLNIMPCVFPILSLKAMSLARAGESETQARAEGLAYTAGVVLACLGLGGLLLGLRAAGEEVGWAFQLQEPGVVALLLLLATAITANFLGLFEVAVPGFARHGSPQGAFATGLLAAFVATPCTGPFMAAAMGAALLLPLAPALALFGALGLGIALPFLAIAFIPALRRRLPRPGPWMQSFRRWMGLPMALTAGALVWLAGRLAGGRFALLCALLALALVAVLWLAGRSQRAGKPALSLTATGLLAIAVAAFAVLPAAIRTPSAQGTGVLPAEPFSDAALAAARASGKPVFAWFTADWCLTCKVNERVAIERPEVRDAFARAGVVALRGDWTRRDPAITRYLATQGAAGVPLYVWYPADGGRPRQLPQVLTPDSLTELVGR